MRISYAAIVLCLLMGWLSAYAAQSRMPEVPLLVMEQKWRSERRVPRAEQDPFEAIKEHEEYEKQRIQNIRINEARRAQGMPPINPPVRPMKNDTGSKDATISYFYQMKVKNTGKLEIRRIRWEYVFFDIDTDKEVGRRQFESEVRIAPGTIKTVQYRSAVSPTITINAARSGNDAKEKYREKIEIRQIQFADGTYWASSN